ncbi:unnamed protein product [Soboliphyme baturini]|uniref:Uncharacterized protein n=1 Tax=Soboliphyme baturini TaxID=241478 RepID=A0A183J638_9BILA|nr:unnamed protein product [Soboliphyme baturini]
MSTSRKELRSALVHEGDLMCCTVSGELLANATKVTLDIGRMFIKKTEESRKAANSGQRFDNCTHWRYKAPEITEVASRRSKAAEPISQAQRCSVWSHVESDSHSFQWQLRLAQIDRSSTQAFLVIRCRLHSFPPCQASVSSQRVQSVRDPKLVVNPAPLPPVGLAGLNETVTLLS